MAADPAAARRARRRRGGRTEDRAGDGMEGTGMMGETVALV